MYRIGESGDPCGIRARVGMLSPKSSLSGQGAFLDDIEDSGPI
jgi:hypothetical protein